MTKSISKTLAALLLSCLVTSLTACSEKPCEPIPTPDHLTELGVVLEGSRVCKDGQGASTLHFPGTTPEAIETKYQSKMSEKGWEMEQIREGMLYGTHEAEDRSMLIVSGKDSDSRTTFAVITHCQPGQASCTERLDGLAKASRDLAAK